MPADRVVKNFMVKAFALYSPKPHNDILLPRVFREMCGLIPKFPHINEQFVIESLRQIL